MFLDDLADGLVGGTTWGLGVALIAGTVLLAGRGGRPLAKGAVKGYLTLRERVRGVTHEAAEQLHDIYEEAQAEIAEVVEVVVGDFVGESGDDSDLRATAAAGSGA